MVNSVHILLAYGKRQRLIRLDVPLWFARFLLLTLAVAPLMVGYLIVDRNRRATDQYELAALRYENTVLRGKMDMFSASVDSLRAELGELAEHDAQVRLSASLPVVHRDIRYMGIGGGSVGSNDPGAELQTSIDNLLEQARFQRRSLNVLATELEKRALLQTNTPSILPTAGWITSPFGSRRDPFTNRWVLHEGIDIVGVPGQPIRATANGTVIAAGWHQNWGRIVEIDHGRGIHTFYAHNSRVLVKEGETVRRGQTIATLGSTGRSTGNHCHYGVRVNGVWVNPAKYVLGDLSQYD